MIQIFIKVPAINKVAYNCLGAASSRTILLADSFCLVRSTSNSFFESEKRAASLPAMANDNKIKTSKSPNKKIEPCGHTVSNKSEQQLISPVDGGSKRIGLDKFHCKFIGFAMM